MDYRIRRNKVDLESTGYMEIGPGKYAGLHWQEGFIFVRDDAFAVAEGVIEKHFPDYDHLEMNDIPKGVAIKIISEWKKIADRVPNLARPDIEPVMNLVSSKFRGLEQEIDSHRNQVSAFLRSIATECENFIRESDWICILGM